jgi:FkbH-like protein
MSAVDAILPSFADLLAFNAGAERLPCGHGIRVAILSNFTAEGVEPFLTFHCLKNGIRPAIALGGFDTVMQDLIGPTSLVHDPPAELVVLALMLEQLDPAYGEPDWRGAGAIERLSDLFRAAAAHTQALVAVHTFIAPFDADLGIAGGAELSERIQEVGAVNRFIRDFVLDNAARFILLDWERMARICGERDTMDYRFWYLSKAPFRPPFLNLWALEIVKVVRVLKGKAKKCLLLDCDNTLWGGVVGEAGLSGIALDRHSYPGNVFHDFQKQVLRFYQRGVLIALVSKNNEEDVWEVLDRHPDCLIKREHLAAWRINWGNKAQNISSIAEALNLGTDSMVFLDDSPMECELVRTMLPEVEVLQVPGNLSTFPRLLSRDGLFDTLALSAEDRKRSSLYRAEAERSQARLEFATPDQYLASLGLVATIRLAREEDAARVSQLTQKTNQFNLTTRRYSSARIESFSRSCDAAVFSLQVSDRFGDSGLTGVLIALREGKVGRIDSFLLSCRILGRNLETVFLDRCLALLGERWGVSEWLSEYVASQKNGQTADFYARAGFTPLQTGAAGTSYRCDARQRAAQPVSYITVKE